MRIETRRPIRWPTVARFALATGLMWAAGQSLLHGGPVSVVFAIAQGAIAFMVVIRPDGVAPLALAAITLVPGAFSVARNWTARLPLACKCTGPVHAVPGLLSPTGLGFAAHVVLIALAVTLARRKDAANRE